MRNIKQVLYAAAATALAAVPMVAGAVDATPTPTKFTVPADGTGGLKNTSFFSLFTTFMNWLLGLIGVLAVIAFVISGILYLTAAGNEERIETAKSTMLYAIIGIVVALLGLIIVNALAGLTGAGTVQTF